MFINFLQRINTEARLTMKHWLLISCLFSCVLVCTRVLITNQFTYLFLIWNLFLAIIPYLISEWLSMNIPVIENKWKRSITLLLWLLFIPNSFYILTDLVHLDHFNSAPKWFDLLLLLSFSWNGLVLGILSIRKVELIAGLSISGNFKFRNLKPLFLFVIMWLNAFGIYIGRYLRFNSWDIIMQPFSLLAEMIQLIIHPFQNKMEWGMITTWAVFMTLMYMMVRKLSEQFNSLGK